MSSPSEVGSADVLVAVPPADGVTDTQGEPPAISEVTGELTVALEDDSQKTETQVGTPASDDTLPQSGSGSGPETRGNEEQEQEQEDPAATPERVSTEDDKEAEGEEKEENEEAEEKPETPMRSLRPRSKSGPAAAAAAAAAAETCFGCDRDLSLRKKFACAQRRDHVRLAQSLQSEVTSNADVAKVNRFCRDCVIQCESCSALSCRTHMDLENRNLCCNCIQ